MDHVTSIDAIIVNVPIIVEKSELAGTAALKVVGVPVKGERDTTGLTSRSLIWANAVRASSPSIQATDCQFVSPTGDQREKHII